MYYVINLSCFLRMNKNIIVTSQNKIILCIFYTFIIFFVMKFLNIYNIKVSVYNNSHYLNKLT